MSLPTTRSADAADGVSVSMIALPALIMAVALAYGNSLHNDFQLDDSYGLVENRYIRDLGYIPRYFVDPFSLTSHKANADYRPILQITYALNFWMSERLARMASEARGESFDPAKFRISRESVLPWHLVQLALHVVVSYSIFRLGRRLFGSVRILPIPWLRPDYGDLAALLAAGLFAVHPITAGCANYMWARSSLLVAAWILPATTLYLRSLAASAPLPANPGTDLPFFGRQGSRLPSQLAALLLYTLGLFTKAEAISFLGIAVLAEALFAPHLIRKAGIVGPLGVDSLRRLAPFVVVTAIYLLIRQALIPPFVADARRATGVDADAYFLTQLRAWWYYIGQVLAPVRFVADETAFPVSRSVFEPRVLLALAGWVLVAAILIRAARTHPAFSFLGASFFIHLAPHSSFSPLAEMLNEHRPYLPSSAVFMLSAIGLVVLARRLTSRPALVATGVALMVAIPLCLLTRERNRVWKDDVAFWADVIEKSPRSARAQMNYGLAILSSMDGSLTQAQRRSIAEEHYRETIKLAPNYHFAHTNLAIVLERRGDLAAARRAHDKAVECGENEESPYYYRGDFLERHGDLKGAAEDYREAVRRSAQPGRSEEALQRVEKRLTHGDSGDRRADTAKVTPTSGLVRNFTQGR